MDAMPMPEGISRGTPERPDCRGLEVRMLGRLT
jgi:hypothetical protein